MHKRRVAAPDGVKWIVGRRWLLDRPRYIGFRFGRPKEEPPFEAAEAASPAPRLVERKPAPTQQPTPPPVRYRNRTPSGVGFPRVVYGGSGSRSRTRGSGGLGGLLRSSGGGSRSRSSGGGGRSRSSGGGRRGGGGGAGAAGGILAALVQFLKYVLVAAAIVVAALIVVFVLLPSLLFLAHYAAFWLIVGGTIVYRAMTGRPWIVEMEEADGFRVRAWRVVGWRQSKRVIDQVADALLRGVEPVADGAEDVEIVNLAEAS